MERMNIFELIERLSKFDKKEIEFALTALMLKGKIDFINLSNAYVEYLNNISEDRLNQLIEAETCVCESFIYNKSKDKKKHRGGDYNHTQRCLYLMNKSKRFQMNSLNDKYEYDEDFAKEMSWYERNKKERKY